MSGEIDYYDVQAMIRDARSEIRGEISDAVREAKTELRNELGELSAELREKILRVEARGIAP